METKTWPLPLGDVPKFELSTPFADVVVLPVEPGKEPRMETPALMPADAVAIDQVDGVVRVRLGGERMIRFFDFKTVSRVAIYLPKNVRARLRSEFGRVRIEGLDAGCDLEVSASAGAIALEKLTGRFVIRSGAGAVTGYDLAGTFDVETAAGSVKLGVIGLERGRHRMRTNMGAVRVDLAPGIPVKLVLNTVLGSVRARYPSTDDAPATLELSTELGSVKVRERGTADDNKHGDFPRWDDLPPWQGPGVSPGTMWDRFWNGFAAPTDAAPPKAPVPDEELRRILSMVQEGKINAAEAERLIRAIEGR